MDGQASLGMTALYFIYGLAFFLMGFVILGEVLRSERSQLSTSLLFLALFGLMHGLVEWAEMFESLAASYNMLGWERGLEVLHSVLLPLSVLPLLIFGAKLLADSLEGAWVLWLLPPGLTFTWLMIGLLLPVTLDALTVEESFSTMLAWQEAWARYVLYLPGSLLAAIALAQQSRLFLGLKMGTIARYASLGACAFALNAVVAGLIVPASSFIPAYWLNYDNFERVLGVPPQVFRALAAIAVALGVVQMLRFRDLSQRRVLEAAREESFQLQEQARRQAQEWGLTLERSVKERTEQLEAVARINTEISSQLEIGKLLDLIVEKARQLLGADLAAITLVEGGRGEMAVRSVAGHRTSLFPGVRLALGEGVSGRAVALGRPEVLRGSEGDVDRAEGLESQIAVPLRMRGKSLGAILVASRRPTVDFGPPQVELLSHLASQAAIALENARLYQQVQDLAVVQERERLAREMHDSLAQVLGYLRLEMSRVSGLLADGKLTAATSAMEAMDRVAETAFADVRENILGLRSTVTQARDLMSTLRDYLHIFSLQHQIKATLDVEPGIDYQLSPAVEVQLVRIIQEAMTNVRKHAQAKEVTVSFGREGDGVKVVVEDNGRGFDPSMVARNGTPRFGLATMRERAESVGGRFGIDTRLEVGTRVSVWVPTSVGKGAGSYEAAKANGGGRSGAVP